MGVAVRVTEVCIETPGTADSRNPEIRYRADAVRLPFKQGAFIRKVSGSDPPFEGHSRTLTDIQRWRRWDFDVSSTAIEVECSVHFSCRVGNCAVRYEAIVRTPAIQCIGFPGPPT